jgi:putative PIN family toxin of toxin-antitoxin system
MIRYFLDTSVLVSALLSSKGHAADLIMAGARKDVVLVVSADVILELRETLLKKYPRVVPLVDTLLEQVAFEIIEPEKTAIEQALVAVTDPDDAHILAAAKIASLDALVTFDRKHLIKQSVIDYLGIPVITPKEAFDKLS